MNTSKIEISPLPPDVLVRAEAVERALADAVGQVWRAVQEGRALKEIKLSWSAADFVKLKDGA